MPGAETLGPVAPALEDGKAPDAVEAETVPATLETDAEEKQNPKTVASSPATSHVADEGEGGEPKKNNDDSNGLPTPRYQPNELGTPLLTPTGLKTRPTSAPEVPSPAEPPFTQPTHPKPSVKEDKVVPESGKGGIKRKEFEDPFTTVTTPLNLCQKKLSTLASGESSRNGKMALFNLMTDGMKLGQIPKGMAVENFWLCSKKLATIRTGLMKVINMLGFVLV